MEQLCYIIQQIYSVLNILSLHSQDEREELVVGYQCFPFDINDVLIVLDRIVEGSMYWGWKINWGYQPWQLRTYCEQKGLTSSGSEIGNSNEACETLAHEEGSDLDSMPELEDEINLDTLEIPVWLIPQGVVVNFRNGRVTFETEQGPPWQEVLAQMLEEQNQTSE